MDKRRLYSKASAPRDPRDPHRASLGSSSQPRPRNRRVAKPVRVSKRDAAEAAHNLNEGRASTTGPELARPASALSDMSADTMTSGIEQPRSSPPQATPEQPKPKDDAMLRFRGEDVLASFDDFSQDFGNGQLNTSTRSDRGFEHGAHNESIPRRSSQRQPAGERSRQSLPAPSSTTTEAARPRRTKMKTRPVQSRYLSGAKPASASLNASTASDRRASRGRGRPHHAGTAHSKAAAASAATATTGATPGATPAASSSSSSAAARRTTGSASTRRAPLPRSKIEDSARRGDGTGARLPRRNAGASSGAGGVTKPRRGKTRSSATGPAATGDDSLLSRHLRLRAYVLQWMYVVALQERGMRHQEAAATQAFRAATSHIGRIQQQVTRLALTKEAVVTHQAVDKATRTLASNLPEPQAMARLQETLHGVLSALDVRSRQLPLRGVLGESSGDLAAAFQDAHARVRDLGILLGTQVRSSDLLHQATHLKEILQALNSSANELAGMLHHATRALYKLSTLQYQRQHVQGAFDSTA